MFDDTIYEVHPLIAAALPKEQEETPQEEVQPEVVQVEAPEQIAQAPAQPQESPQQLNFRILKERAERAERERDQILKFAQQHMPKQDQPAPKKASGYDFNIGNDDIVEGKHLSPIQQELREIKEELNQYKQQNTNYSAETRLRAQYPDFDRVCSKDNIEMFANAYPELANTLRSSQDLYNTGVSAYTLIKKFNIDQTGQVDMERTQKNLSKPKSTNSIAPQQGDNPLSRANAFAQGLTEDLKKQMVKEMNEARKGY